MPGTFAVLAALLSGIATVFSFAPFGASALPALTLAGLFALWQGAASPRRAFALGFAFGLGLFGAGVSWVSVALSGFGGMPPAARGDRHRRILRVSGALPRARGMDHRAHHLTRFACVA